jgi:membrane protein implicated in regulation of membrane protease activity
MPWWGWIIFGTFLLGSELLAIDAAFYLVFIGIAAILTGLAGLIGLELELWVQWMLFAGLSLVTMVLFRKQLYQKIRGGGVGYDASPVGDILKLEETLPPGDKCRMAHRGTTWTILNSSNEAIDKGSNVRVNSVEGLTLVISSAITNK